MLLFILFMAMLLGSYTGLTPLNASLNAYHAYPMLFIIFSQFFLGFLFVVFPRFLMQAVIKPAVYMQVFFLYTGGSLLYLLLLFIAPELTPAASLILLGGQVRAFVVLYGIYGKSIMKDKYDTRWTLVAFGSGIGSHLLYLLGTFDIPYAAVIESFAVKSGFYLFLFMLIFAIAQRMVPLFTQTKVHDYAINKSAVLLETLFGLLLLKVIVLTMDAPALNLIADIPLFAFFVREALRWKLPAFKVPAIIWVLYLALAWIPLGFAFSIIESLVFILSDGTVGFEKSVLHAFAIGYFTTMLIGFGSRVVLGHSGRTPTADRATVFIFFFIEFIVVARVFAGLSTNLAADYVFWINVSAALMLTALVAWSAKYLKYLVVPKYIP